MLTRFATLNQISAILNVQFCSDFQTWTKFWTIQNVQFLFSFSKMDQNLNNQECSVFVQFFKNGPESEQSRMFSFCSDLKDLNMKMNMHMFSFWSGGYCFSLLKMAVPPLNSSNSLHIHVQIQKKWTILMFRSMFSLLRSEHVSEQSWSSVFVQFCGIWTWIWTCDMFSFCSVLKIWTWIWTRYFAPLRHSELVQINLDNM